MGITISLSVSLSLLLISCLNINREMPSNLQLLYTIDSVFSLQQLTLIHVLFFILLKWHCCFHINVISPRMLINKPYLSFNAILYRKMFINKSKFSFFKNQKVWPGVMVNTSCRQSLPCQADDHFGSKHGTVNLPATCCCFQMSLEPRWRPCGQTANACFHCRCGRPTKKLWNSSGCEHVVTPDYGLCFISNSKVKS